MNFDYRFGTESTFLDWVDEGIAKAEAILDETDSPESTDNITSDEKQNS